jgi:putative ABC transport system permease protein
VFVPLEMVKEMNRWAGNDQNKFYRPNHEVYDTLIVNVPDRNRVDDVVNQIKAMGYNAFSPATELQAVNTVFLVIQIVLGGIGAISLLVATIGIVNTMVMSILERTREIGIMKVLGATIPNILHMFIIEAGTIGFLGGVAGLLLSYSIAGIINLIFKFIASREPNWDSVGDRIAVIPWWLTLSALIFASVVGVLAGIYPAMRAAKLSPLNAIRQE